MSQSFYEEMISRDYYQNEKLASDNTVEDGGFLGSMSSEQLEALAAELDLSIDNISKEATDVETEGDKKEVDDKRDKDNEEKVKDPGNPEEAAESEEKEQAKTEQEQEEMVNPVADEEMSVSASDFDLEEMTKIAYLKAEETLVSAGVTLPEYVFNTVGEEKIAYEIADKAEKLAFLAGKSSLQVADDIMENMSSIMNNL